MGTHNPMPVSYLIFLKETLLSFPSDVFLCKQKQHKYLMKMNIIQIFSLQTLAGQSNGSAELKFGHVYSMVKNEDNTAHNL